MKIKESTLMKLSVILAIAIVVVSYKLYSPSLDLISASLNNTIMHSSLKAENSNLKN